MYNITKIPGGFQHQECIYLLIPINSQAYVAISQEQLHVYTDQGIILLDLTCTIDGNSYTDINMFGQELTN